MIRCKATDSRLLENTLPRQGVFLCKGPAFCSFLFTPPPKVCYTMGEESYLEDTKMEHIKTLDTKNLCESAKNGGCSECQTSCQSACKTSCGIANQQCENK